MTLDNGLGDVRIAAIKVVFDSDGKIQAAGCRIILAAD
jgi:hypothetical protein